mgnify:CR=1 FL=1
MPIWHINCVMDWLNVKDNRPTNININTIKFPLPAISSILHRISGVFIFVGIAFLLYILELSLQSESGFTSVLVLLDHFLVKFLAWAILAGLLFHLIAGFKHLLMDLGIGESFEAGLLGARLVFGVSIIATLVAGIWIW